METKKKPIKCRVPYPCSYCGATINKGDLYIKVSWFTGHIHSTALQGGEGAYDYGLKRYHVNCNEDRLAKFK